MKSFRELIESLLGGREILHEGKIMELQDLERILKEQLAEGTAEQRYVARKAPLIIKVRHHQQRYEVYHVLLEGNEIVLEVEEEF